MLTKTYNYILITGSLIGFIVSFSLMIETIKLIQNPSADVPCNISPFVNCTNAALSPQGHIFGFPNPLLGISVFSALFVISLGLILGNQFSKKFWQFLNLLLLISMVFVVWFVYQSLYVLGTLCVYCMITWTVTWPMFLYTTIWNYNENNLPENPILKFVSKNHPIFLLSFYVVAIILSLLKFREYFLY